MSGGNGNSGDATSGIHTADMALAPSNTVPAWRLHRAAFPPYILSKGGNGGGATRGHARSGKAEAKGGKGGHGKGGNGGATTGGNARSGKAEAKGGNGGAATGGKAAGVRIGKKAAPAATRAALLGQVPVKKLGCGILPSHVGRCRANSISKLITVRTAIISFNTSSATWHSLWGFTTL
jgi:hypothetical protein